MIVKEAIDKINDSVEEIVGSYVELKQKGRSYQAYCPFHDEKTPSFVVTPAKGLYHCFGCGKGGDAINFIQEHEGCDFKDALKKGASILNFQFEWDRKENDFNEAEYKHKESLYLLNKRLADFFSDQLPKHPTAVNYFKKRDQSTDNDFMIGYAPSGDTFFKAIDALNLNRDLLLELGVIGKSTYGDGEGFYFRFQNRLMFPICNKNGKVVGFTGRDITWKKGDKKGKYVNSPESAIFQKGEELYGLNVAKGAIKRADRAYLVEGNTDVTRLHQIGISNTVGASGTALSIEQITLLKRFSNKVTLVYDGDDAGKNAVLRNLDLLIREQCYVGVVILPQGEDPDSYFKTIDTFEKYTDENYIDAIAFKVKHHLPQAKKDPHFRSDLVASVSKLIVCYDDQAKQDLFTQIVSQLIGPKKWWEDTIKGLRKNKTPEESLSHFPDNVKLDDVNKWGFYADDYHNYRFSNNKGAWTSVSNFTMRPLFLVEDYNNAKRLFEVTNDEGCTKIIELSQKDLMSIPAFCLRMENHGDFVWSGGMPDLIKLKKWLYKSTKTAIEVVQLGQHKDGFWAWGNGIYANGEFQRSDDYGIVKYNNKFYYIPALSKIFAKEENLFVFERNFVHYESDILLRDYFKQHVKVFGTNGKVALSFYIASLMLDLISKRFFEFPLLNMFGPKGAGKNACADSLLYFFGHKQPVPNVFTATEAALADHVATTRNGLCGLDEYRNDMDVTKREWLKGIWQHQGRMRMNMDKDKKKETTSVDQGVCICGQQMATADIALFNRFISLSFTQTKFSKAEDEEYQTLKSMFNKGLTHITHKILNLRSYFERNYSAVVDRVDQEYRTLLNGKTIETRTYNNWLTIISAYATLHGQLELPWDYDEFIETTCKLMVDQHLATGRNDDLGVFWNKFQVLIGNNAVFEEGDYKVRYEAQVKRRYGNSKDDFEAIEWKEPKNLLYLVPGRVLSLYRTLARSEQIAALPVETVEHYLKHCDAFLFETKKETFHKIDPKTGLQETLTDTSSGTPKSKKKYTSTTALVFDLDKLDLSMNEVEEDKTPF